MAEEPASWYLRSRGRVRGPFSYPQLELMRNRGQLAQFDELSQDRKNWTPAGRVAGLFGSTPAAGATSGSDPAMTAAAPAQSAEGWYCNTLTGTVGPVAIAHVVSLLHGGRLSGNSLVWKAGFPAWVAVRDVPDLACHLPSSQLAGINSGVGGATAGNFSSTRSPLSATRATWFLAVAAALSVLTAAIAVLALFMSNSKKTAQPPGAGDNHRAESRAPHPAADVSLSALALNQMRDKMGIVVSGFTVTNLKTGVSAETRCRKATCFAISKDGYMLTNKTLVEDHQNLTRAEEKIKEARKNSYEIRPRLWVHFGRDKDRYDVESATPVGNFEFAILKVTRQKPFPFLTLAPRIKTIQGTRVYALGYPEAVSPRLSLDEALKKPPQNQGDDSGNILDDANWSLDPQPGSAIDLVHDEHDTKYIQYTALAGRIRWGPLVLDDQTVVGINVPDSFEPEEAEGGAKKFFALLLSQAGAELNRIVPEVIPK